MITEDEMKEIDVAILIEKARADKAEAMTKELKEALMGAMNTMYTYPGYAERSNEKAKAAAAAAEAALQRAYEAGL